VNAVWVERALEFLAFEYAFVQYSALSAVVVGVMCGVSGVWMVLRGLSLVGDATAHATLPGLCLAFLLTGSSHSAVLMSGALASGLCAMAVLHGLQRWGGTRPDSSLAVVLASFFGLGVALMQRVTGSPGAARAGLQSFLLGNAASVTPAQAWLLTGMMVALIALTLLFFRALQLSTFDPSFARLSGFRPDRVRIATTALLAIVVVLAVRAVGLVLVSAMLVLPASTSLLVSRRLSTTLLLSGVMGGLCGFAGAWAGYVWQGVATGPAMVVMAGLIFALVAGGQSLVALRQQTAVRGGL
jgi:manganese/zinc/iron transport system permease protein